MATKTSTQTTPTTPRRVLRMNRLQSNGDPAPGTITLVVRDPYTGEELRNDDGSPAVWIELHVISDEERREVLKEHTTPQKDPQGGRGLFEYTDQQALSDALIRRAIARWGGFVGADDRPLVCTDRTKVALDERVKMQVTRKLFGVEVVDLAASFRES